MIRNFLIGLMVFLPPKPAKEDFVICHILLPKDIGEFNFVSSLRLSFKDRNIDI